MLSYVNPKGRARSAGIVYVPIDRVLYVRAAKDSWKAKHILLNPRVALNVTTSLSSLFSARRSLTSVLVASRTVLPLNCFLPASRNSLLHR